MRIAFYAPMKPPDHRVPSGDRRMARLFLKALAAAGHEVEVASRFRAYEGRGNRARQRTLAARGRAEAKRLAERYGRARLAPELWFTYHLYHKAPDWLGPAVSTALGIPYVAAEASDAAKQGNGPWAAGYRAAADAIGGAHTVLALTRHDLPGLEPRIGAGGRLVFLPPFLEALPAATPRGRARRTLAAALDGLDPEQPWLLTVAMMRPGDKLRSYRVLAETLRRLNDRSRQLIVVGDGAARNEVEAGFAGIEGVFFAGRRGPGFLKLARAAADVFPWPAVGEAYGMAILEAQAAGLPVVAGAARGVPDVVRDGRSALLAPPDQPEALAQALDALLADPVLRAAMAEAARRFVASERTLAVTVPVLKDILEETRQRFAAAAGR